MNGYCDAVLAPHEPVSGDDESRDLLCYRRTKHVGPHECLCGYKEAQKGDGR